MKKDNYWQEKILVIVDPDETPIEQYPKYKYSDGLFDWFYKRLKYWSEERERFVKCKINKERTKQDNSENGCRIILHNGDYIKFYEIYLLMEFTRQEHKELFDLSSFSITLEDVVNYYYKYKAK